ncbi:MAG: hypothetical protein EOO29_12485 [Comamonadaceae bacterium]|nr:MAG: hypothetical protein EOO29_12485 [Comamonadaceae bacterium]
MHQQITVGSGMDATFTRWAALTDAYAEQLAAMERGEPEARAVAVRLSHELRGLNGALADVSAGAGRGESSTSLAEWLSFLTRLSRRDAP